MIFDNVRALYAYEMFVRTQEHVYLNDLHTETMPLIEVIALSVNQQYYLDLVQEAHEKLTIIATTVKYQRSKGNFYAFLSTALRNAMISYLRKERTHDELDEEYCEVGASMDGFLVERKLLPWVCQRFPSYPEPMVCDAAVYIACALDERVRGQNRGIKRTLQMWYPFDDWSQVTTFYNSVVAYSRIEDTRYEEEALLVVKHTSLVIEKTMLPEVVLAIGAKSATALIKVLHGSYVKF